MIRLVLETEGSGSLMEGVPWGWKRLAHSSADEQGQQHGGESGQILVIL